MPMFLDICQAPKPNTVQGKSLMELIENPQKPINNYVFSEFLGRSMVYDGRYKYVHYISGGEELFDLQEDPQEINNRSKEDTLFKIKSDLKSKLIEHMLECQNLHKQRITVETHPERKRIDEEYKQYRMSIKD
jgi:arylsulfatase